MTCFRSAAMLGFCWRDWLRIITGFVSSWRYRRLRTSGERLGWLLIVGTIPVGISGLLLEHLFRTTLGRPIPAAAFLIANGVVLFVGERLRRRADTTAPVPATTGAGGPGSARDIDAAADARLARMSLGRATLIGSGPEVLTRVSMVGNDLQLDEGVGVCGKESQSVPVGGGQPTLKIDAMNVGVTAA